MLGFSLSKLVVLAVIVTGVWYLFRMLGGPPPKKNVPPSAGGEARPQGQRRIEAEDTVRCTACGTYVTAGARSCGRSDCPYGR
ncbi:MAG TPA: hypothetical protein VMC10_01030 [Stellaceae bacterium]|nr:hypothetical protein [Stellaceae bacterium]